MTAILVLAIATSVDERLQHLRSDARYRWGATAAGVAAGLALSTVHWGGLVVGGALVGLAARDLGRALAAGLGFGVLAYGVFLARLALDGALSGYVATGQVAVVAAVVPIGLGILGSLARGIA